MRELLTFGQLQFRNPVWRPSSQGGEIVVEHGQRHAVLIVSLTISFPRESDFSRSFRRYRLKDKPAGLNSFGIHEYSNVPVLFRSWCFLRSGYAIVWIQREAENGIES